MKRRIIKINPNLCNGCALCAQACHEGAIGIVDDKAVLLRDDYCDGLGDCLPVCPTGAISFEEREAAEFCERKMVVPSAASTTDEPSSDKNATSSSASQLRQWPVQLKLAPVKASYFDGAHVLIAADCAAYAYANFHNDFMKNSITLIGCPKLDGSDYSEKLKEIFSQNDIQSITVVRMQVPCCGGLTQAVARAIKESGKAMQGRVITISTDGQVLGE